MQNMICYVIPDQSVFHNNNLDEVYEQSRADMSYFDNKDSVVKLVRKNDDMSSNNYGYKLIDFCKDNSLLILNGRLEGKKRISNL